MFQGFGSRCVGGVGGASRAVPKRRSLVCAKITDQPFLTCYAELRSPGQLLLGQSPAQSERERLDTYTQHLIDGPPKAGAHLMDLAVVFNGDK